MAFKLLDQRTGPTFEPRNERNQASEGEGTIDRWERHGCGKWALRWEFLCQWAHLTASLMDDSDVPQGPDGIQWSAR